PFEILPTDSAEGRAQQVAPVSTRGHVRILRRSLRAVSWMVRKLERLPYQGFVREIDVGAAIANASPWEVLPECGPSKRTPEGGRFRSGLAAGGRPSGVAHRKPRRTSARGQGAVRDRMHAPGAFGNRPRFRGRGTVGPALLGHRARQPDHRSHRGPAADGGCK